MILSRLSPAFARGPAILLSVQGMPTPGLPRRLFAVTLLLGTFLLLDIALLGWLAFRTLSEREIERVLLETRQEAEGLAGRLAGRAEVAGDLFTALAVEKETQTYIDSVLSQRELVETVEVRDEHGVLVLRGRTELTIPVPSEQPLGREAAGARPGSPPAIEVHSEERQRTFNVTVPIGAMGTLRLGVSPLELERRIGGLRRRLVRQTGLVAGTTLLLVALAYGLILRLIERGRRLEAQAASSAHLAELGSVAAGIAHEIRNPLNSLNLNFQLLEEELAERGVVPARGRLLALTRSEIARLDRLVGDFLAYARPGALERGEVDAASLLADVRELLSAELAAAGVAATVEVAPGMRPLFADRERLRQVLLNLVRNAVQAMEGTSDSRRLWLRAAQTARESRLEVEDSGPGVAEADRERIFELFFSGRKGGSGLGLAIARRIVEAHGGGIEVGTGEAGGARFTVSLPSPAVAGERRPAPHQAGNVAS